MNKTACLDPTYAFQDFQTFSGCFYSWGNATDDAPAVILPTDSTFGGVIRGCVSEYCNAPSSALGKSRNNMDEDRHYTLTLRPVVDFYSKICIGVNNHVNTDIAGPGVCILWPTTSATELIR